MGMREPLYSRRGQKQYRDNWDRIKRNEEELKNGKNRDLTRDKREIPETRPRDKNKDQ